MIPPEIQAEAILLELETKQTFERITNILTDEDLVERWKDEKQKAKIEEDSNARLTRIALAYEIKKRAEKQ